MKGNIFLYSLVYIYHFDRTGIREVVNRFIHIDISVTIYVIDLKCAVFVLNIPLDGSMSQIFYLGPSLYFMSKIG